MLRVPRSVYHPYHGLDSSPATNTGGDGVNVVSFAALFPQWEGATDLIEYIKNNFHQEHVSTRRSLRRFKTFPQSTEYCLFCTAT